MLTMKMTPYQSGTSSGLHARQAEQAAEVEALQDRQEDRHREQQDADPVEKHAEHEQDHHHQQQDAVGRAGRCRGSCSATKVWPPLTMKKPTNIVAPKKIHITIAVAFSVAMAGFLHGRAS